MAIALRLVKLLAKVSLDLLIGSTRTDEVMALFHDWWCDNDPPSRDRELTEAKRAAFDKKQLEKIIRETVAVKEAGITPDQLTVLRDSLRSTLKALPDQLRTDPPAAKFQRWAQEWASLPPAIRPPRPGSQAAKLFNSIDGAPASYRQLWQWARFDKDPFLRTTLRKWAKAGWVDRIVDADGSTELWSVPVAETVEQDAEG
jgi:hypothetical protein